MEKNKRFLVTFLILALFLSVLLWADPSRALGIPNQTIPTRTPTPGATVPNTPRPTATTDNGGGDPTAVPTSTQPPTATETMPANQSPTATSTSGQQEFIPTAQACGDKPTLQAIDQTIVRQGPGDEYPNIYTLTFPEVRLILGRAADSPWWLIKLANNSEGWVMDEEVVVQGYTGGLPLISAPEINGQTPTPGTPWHPTPNPICTVTPTATAEPTIATAEIETVAGETGGTVIAETVATELPNPTQTAVSQPTLPPATADQSDDVEIVGIDLGDSGNNLGNPTNRIFVDYLLPISGFLLVAGGFWAVFNRRRQVSGE